MKCGSSIDSNKSNNNSDSSNSSNSNNSNDSVHSHGNSSISINFRVTKNVKYWDNLKSAIGFAWPIIGFLVRDVFICCNVYNVQEKRVLNGFATIVILSLARSVLF